MKHSKLLSTVLSATLLLTSATPAFAFGEQINTPHSPYIKTEMPVSIQVDGAWLPTDTAPIIENGRTLIPLRACGEAVGAEVNWDQASRTATAEINGLTVKFTIGSNTYTVNGYEYTTDVAPMMNGWRTMLPIRAFGDAIGVGVSWDNYLRKVDIDTPAPDAPTPGTPNGGDPEYSQLLLKYYVPADPEKPLNGTYLADRFPNSDYWEMTAISISQADDGTIRTAIIDDKFPTNRSFGNIALYIDDGSTATMEDNGFSVKVGPGADFILGDHLIDLNSMTRHYKLNGDGLIYTHASDTVGAGILFVQGNNFELTRLL